MHRNDSVKCRHRELVIKERIIYKEGLRGASFTIYRTWLKLHGRLRVFYTGLGVLVQILFWETQEVVV